MPAIRPRPPVKKVIDSRRSALAPATNIGAEWVIAAANSAQRSNDAFIGAQLQLVVQLPLAAIKIGREQQ